MVQKATTLLLAGAIAIAATSLYSPSLYGQGKKKGGGDAEKGKTVYEQCSVCHDAESTDAKIGPGLKGLFKSAKLPERQSHQRCECHDADQCRRQRHAGLQRYPFGYRKGRSAGLSEDAVAGMRRCARARTNAAGSRISLNRMASPSFALPRSPSSKGDLRSA